MKLKRQKIKIKDTNSIDPNVDFISLSEISKMSPYSQEYISLLARKGN